MAGDRPARPHSRVCVHIGHSSVLIHRSSDESISIPGRFGEMSLGAPELATQAYWDSRYEGEDKDGYDWFKTYADLAGFFKTHLQETSRILVLGCGTSALTTELYEQGYKHITSMDFSPVAIDIMKRQNIARRELSFDVMDIRDLSYENASFDFAIDVSTNACPSIGSLTSIERYHGCHAVLQR